MNIGADSRSGGLDERGSDGGGLGGVRRCALAHGESRDEGAAKEGSYPWDAVTP